MDGCTWYFVAVEEHLGRVQDQNNRRNTLCQSFGQSRFDRFTDHSPSQEIGGIPRWYHFWSTPTVSTCTSTWWWYSGMFGARFAGFIQRPRAISTHQPDACDCTKCQCVWKPLNWKEKNVKRGGFFFSPQDRSCLKSHQTRSCTSYGWLYLYWVFVRTVRVLSSPRPATLNLSLFDSNGGGKTPIGLPKWAHLHALKGTEALF